MKLMKSYFLLLFIAIDIMSCYSQDIQYHPFVEEGKVWNMKCSHAFPQPVDYDYCYYIQGDTLIANVACKKMYAYNELDTKATEYKLALYEDNCIVYFILKNQEVSYVLYDFSIPVDSTSSINSANVQHWIESMKNNVDRHFCFKGIKRHSLLVNQVGVSNTRPLGLPAGWWIEGIGSELGPLNQSLFHASGTDRFLQECEVNGETIFTISELRKQNPVGDINVDGVRDINDLMQLVNYLVGQTVAGFVSVAADIDYNGRLDVSDVMSLVNYLVNYSKY